MDVNFWSHDDSASPSLGHDRLSVSSTADSPSAASTLDPLESLTSESATFSPSEVKFESDDAFASLASPVSDPRPGHDVSPVVMPQHAPPHDAVKAEPPPPPTEGKRRRGRPRKHPLVKPSPPDGKANNGRSKTGCITCRRRKKKCDEAKPGCMNCRKNNVACEGYRKPTAWQSGRSKNDKTGALPPLLNGMADEIDRLLLQNFLDNLSPMLYLGNSSGATPLNDLIIPLAVGDRGLLYSVLCLSGFKLSENGPDSECDPALQNRVFQRTLEHGCSAFRMLNDKLDLLKANDQGSSGEQRDPSAVADDTTIAHIMMLCLQTIVSGDCAGQYRFHLGGLYDLIYRHQSTNDEFRRFSQDFLLFYSTCSSITCTPSNRLPTYFPERFRLPEFVPPEAGSYFGILDGLFLFLHQITELRDRIRDRRARRLDPPVDYPAVHVAQRIDADLRAWVCHQPAGTTLETASLLYQKCTWIYLHRTILPSRPQPNLRAGVEEGLALLRALTGEDAVQAVLVMPLFLLGVSAFEPAQRPAIGHAFDVLAGKRGAASIGHVRRVVEAMWRLMDAGDEDSWDWEALMSRMDLDFLLS